MSCAASHMCVFMCTHMFVHTHSAFTHACMWDSLRKAWRQTGGNKERFIGRAREAGNYSSLCKRNPVTLSELVNRHASKVPLLLTLFELSLYFHLIASLIFSGNNYKTNFSNKIKLLLCSTQTVIEQVGARFPSTVLQPRALGALA